MHGLSLLSTQQKSRDELYEPAYSDLANAKHNIIMVTDHFWFLQIVRTFKKISLFGHVPSQLGMHSTGQ